ncbi:beta-N-acetylhexosaminidase [Knoellia remsis]|uniref:Beta-N-acetylhexosaminidase n=1 Tax=Knoellia remsis TaxID=407159 RepID=A0A2T0UY58_9MICO|nr:beta-N-acetylhexosaminidase [Knoellia remsis]PRY62852.1 beta-N-acetylhexosaminidase [Knoellia remsis]
MTDVARADAALRRDALGSLIVGLPGHEATDELRRAVGDGLGGVVLFTRNVRDADQLTGLVASLRSERPDLLVAIDHEGGEFSHLSAVNPWPLAAPRTLGDLDDIALTRDSARDAAAMLDSFGIDVMLAPSADVNSNPGNPIISTRAFGTTVERVSRHAVAFVEGVHDAGIAACAKHFPGHGDVSVDSHVDLPRVDRTAAEVSTLELEPFRAVIDAGVDVIMTAHIVFSTFDDAPATLSHRILTGVLRDELGYEGVLTTDALEMGAITRRMTIADATVRCLRAGADLAMIAVGDADAPGTAARLVDAVRAGDLSRERLAEASERVRRLARTLADRPRGGGLDGAPAREVAARVVAASDVPAMGRDTFVVDLAQPLHPAWYPYFDGLPALFGTDGVVVREDDPDAIAAARRRAADRPLVVAVQDAVRTPWMLRSLDELTRNRDGGVLVLVTGIPEDRDVLPAHLPVVVTGGRNVLALKGFAEIITRRQQ